MTGTICGNGPEGALHKWCLSPFSLPENLGQPDAWLDVLRQLYAENRLKPGLQPLSEQASGSYHFRPRTVYIYRGTEILHVGQANHVGHQVLMVVAVVAGLTYFMPA